MGAAWDVVELAPGVKLVVVCHYHHDLPAFPKSSLALVPMAAPSVVPSVIHGIWRVGQRTWVASRVASKQELHLYIFAVASQVAMLLAGLAWMASPWAKSH